jgi:hypothetical protein
MIHVHRVCIVCACVVCASVRIGRNRFIVWSVACGKKSFHCMCVCAYTTRVWEGHCMQYIMIRVKRKFTS